MLKKGPNFAPGGIGDYPIDLFFPLKEVPSFTDLAPGSAWHVAEKIAFSFAGLEQYAYWLKMLNNPFGELWWSLHHVIAVVIAIGLVFHGPCKYDRDSRVQMKFLKICA